MGPNTEPKPSKEKRKEKKGNRKIFKENNEKKRKKEETTRYGSKGTWSIYSVKLPSIIRNKLIKLVNVYSPLNFRTMAVGHWLVSVPLLIFHCTTENGCTSKDKLAS